jgi:hypothetical protein
MKHLLLLLTLFSAQAFSQAKTIVPVPKDPNNIPIYGGLGVPVVSESVTLTTSSYVLLFSLPNGGASVNRSFRHVIAVNPDLTRSVYLCFGSGSCSTDMIKVRPESGLALDHTLFGILYGQTEVWGRLDAPGTVTPEIHVW